MKDHLGNVRLTFIDTNKDAFISAYDDPETEPNELEITQESHYYPFGMQMQGDWFAQQQPVNRYLFNGIEKVDDIGLGWDMAFYRSNDPALGRWMQIDPKAESFRGLSPYNSMGNSPVNFADPNGAEPITLAVLAIGALAGGFGGYKAGKAAGATGGQMLGYIFGGAAIGVASGYASFGVGAATTSSLGMVGGSAVAGAVGGATNAFLGQLAFTGSVDPGAVMKSAFYGFGGGAASGLVDVSALADTRFAMHHTVKHIARSTAFQVGGSIVAGDFSFSNTNFGLDASIIAPAIGDVFSLSSGRIVQKIVNSENFREDVLKPQMRESLKPGPDRRLVINPNFEFNVDNLKGDLLISRSGGLQVFGSGNANISARIEYGTISSNRLLFRTHANVSLNFNVTQTISGFRNANLLNTIYQNRRF